MNELIKLPIWKHCLEKLREDGLEYGKRWPAEFFEEHLKCKRTENKFGFLMIPLRQEVFWRDRLYLEEIEGGAAFRIPTANEMEEIGKAKDRALIQDAKYAIAVREHTLRNPKANLSDSVRLKMERNLERASLRLVMIRRTKTVEKLIKTKSPKLLE